MADVPERISKLLAARGLCSRREADGFIERGWVFVDGVQVTKLGSKALPTQSITLARQAIRVQSTAVTVLLNKPLGFVSGQPEGTYPHALTLVRPENGGEDGPRLNGEAFRGLAPAGRLDVDSQGLMVYTQDGRIARQLVGETSRLEKEYLVRVVGEPTAEKIDRLRFGLALDGRPLQRAGVERINSEQLRFTLVEGRKRQIRRMCDQVGLKVQGLKRVRIGRVLLGGLPEGKWRFLRPGESF